MEISTISSQHRTIQSTTAIPLGQLLRPQIAGGKVAVSVTDFSVYSNYKHITVTPAASQGVGYSASRLRILDTLIDRLVQMKERSLNKETRGETEKYDISTMNSHALEALIQEYTQRFRNLNTQGMQALANEKGINFGLSDSKDALFFDFRI